MWEIIQAGGPVMWPILLCSVVAMAIIGERLWSLQESRVIPAEISARVWQLVAAGELNDRHVAALEQNSPLGRVLAAGLSQRHKPRELVKEAIEDAGRHVVHELEHFLNTLGTIAAVSPLLGLLGTVIGIISAFNAITHGGVGDPRALSGGIGQALIATAAGLCVAIPSLVGYRYLRSRVDKLVIRMEKDALKLVQAIDEQRPLPEPAVAERRQRASA